MEQDALNSLKNIGLTEGEAKTYLALLSLETTSVGAIVDKSGVSASKVYQILERLIKKGLVSMIVQENKKLFTASSPEMILDYLDEEKTKIDSSKGKIIQILPFLKAKKDSESSKPLAEFSKGKRGFLNINNELIDTAKEKDTYFGIGGAKISFKLQHEWYPLSQRLSDKKITQRVIYEHHNWNKKDPQIHKREERINYYPKVLEEKYEDLPNIICLGDNTTITDLNDEGELFSLIIRSKNLTKAISKMLEIIWDKAQKPEGFLEYKSV